MLRLRGSSSGAGTGRPSSAQDAVDHLVVRLDRDCLGMPGGADPAASAHPDGVVGRPAPFRGRGTSQVMTELLARREWRAPRRGDGRRPGSRRPRRAPAGIEGDVRPEVVRVQPDSRTSDRRSRRLDRQRLAAAGRAYPRTSKMSAASMSRSSATSRSKYRAVVLDLESLVIASDRVRARRSRWSGGRSAPGVAILSPGSFGARRS